MRIGPRRPRAGIEHLCARIEKPFPSQNRREIFARARKKLVKRHKKRLRYWPVRCR
jgi:hypothetical protein